MMSVIYIARLFTDFYCLDYNAGKLQSEIWFKCGWHQNVNILAFIINNIHTFGLFHQQAFSVNEDMFHSLAFPSHMSWMQIM